MLPKAAYGLTFVNNEGENARDLLENCMMFRREKIPCDIMGLEPGWMSTHYDFSTEKKWDPERFYMPYWLPENYYGNWSFIYNLHQMGYKLSLWLCCDYDLLWKEKTTRPATSRPAQKARRSRMRTSAPPAAWTSSQSRARTGSSISKSLLTTARTPSSWTARIRSCRIPTASLPTATPTRRFTTSIP